MSAECFQAMYWYELSVNEMSTTYFTVARYELPVDSLLFLIERAAQLAATKAPA
jgi:hypothetical protein